MLTIETAKFRSSWSESIGVEIVRFTLNDKVFEVWRAGDQLIIRRYSSDEIVTTEERLTVINYLLSQRC